MSFVPDRKPLMLDIDPEKAYSFLFLGSTRSGKSTLMKHIIGRFAQKKINILMTESPSADIYGSGEFKKNCIMAPQFMPGIIKLAYKINRNTGNHYQFNFIFDDMISGKAHPQLKKALTIYRNSGIGVMISSQTMRLALGPAERSNINIVFLGYFNDDEQPREIIKAYLSSWFPSDMKMDDRLKMYKDITKNHNWICINNLTGETFVTKIKI